MRELLLAELADLAQDKAASTVDELVHDVDVHAKEIREVYEAEKTYVDQPGYDKWARRNQVVNFDESIAKKDV